MKLTCLPRALSYAASRALGALSPLKAPRMQKMQATVYSNCSAQRCV